MDLKEIVNRPDDKPIEQDEALFVINEYIKIRKGRYVSFSISNPMHVGLMVQMACVAINWLRCNNYNE
jgi:hypothetical protein